MKFLLYRVIYCTKEMHVLFDTNVDHMNNDHDDDDDDNGGCNNVDGIGDVTKISMANKCRLTLQLYSPWISFDNRLLKSIKSQLPMASWLGRFRLASSRIDDIFKKKKKEKNKSPDTCNFLEIALSSSVIHRSRTDRRNIEAIFGKRYAYDRRLSVRKLSSHYFEVARTNLTRFVLMVVSWPISADLDPRVISPWEFQGTSKAKLPHLKSISVFRFRETTVYDPLRFSSWFKEHLEPSLCRLRCKSCTCNK